MNQKPSEGFSPGYCEHLVPAQPNKKITILRIASIILACILAGVLITISSSVPQILFTFIVILIIFVVIVFTQTTREFEYTVASGHLTIDVIYARRRRKTVIETKISEADEIFPISGKNDAKLSKFKGCKIQSYFNKKDSNIYCMYIKDKNTVILFNDCKILIDSIKFYNRSSLTERK